MASVTYRDTFTIKRDSNGFRVQEFIITDGKGTARFSRAQFLSWIRSAIDDDLRILTDDQYTTAVTARFVEITLKMEATTFVKGKPLSDA